MSQQTRDFHGSRYIIYEYTYLYDVGTTRIQDIRFTTVIRKPIPNGNQYECEINIGHLTSRRYVNRRLIRVVKQVVKTTVASKSK